MPRSTDDHVPWRTWADTILHSYWWLWTVLLCITYTPEFLPATTPWVRHTTIRTPLPTTFCGEALLPVGWVRGPVDPYYKHSFASSVEDVWLWRSHHTSSSVSV